jgi:hypothetical protein
MSCRALGSGAPILDPALFIRQQARPLRRGGLLVRFGSLSLRQICDRRATGNRFFEASPIVGKGSVVFNKKHVGFAGPASRDKNTRRLVFRNFEHLLTHG